MGSTFSIWQTLEDMKLNVYDPIWQELCCRDLFCLAKNDQNKIHVAGAGGIEAILTAMNSTRLHHSRTIEPLYSPNALSLH